MPGPKKGPERGVAVISEGGSVIDTFSLPDGPTRANQSSTFTVEKAGTYHIAVHGRGGRGPSGSSGGSGAFAVRKISLRSGDILQLSITSASTRVVMNDVTLVEAGAANGINGGVASGGNVHNLHGSSGSGSGSGLPGSGNRSGLGGSPIGSQLAGGAGAPSMFPWARGGSGGNGSNGSAASESNGGSPGGGMGEYDPGAGIGGSNPGGGQITIIGGPSKI